MSLTPVLPAELTIYTVAELYPVCRAWVDACGSTETASSEPATSRTGLRVDARAVVEVDAAGVQLLMSLANTLQARQSELELDGSSAVLRAACLALGVPGLLSQGDLNGALP